MVSECPVSLYAHAVALTHSHRAVVRSMRSALDKMTLLGIVQAYMRAWPWIRDYIGDSANVCARMWDGDDNSGDLTHLHMVSMCCKWLAQCLGGRNLSMSYKKRSVTVVSASDSPPLTGVTTMQTEDSTPWLQMQDSVPNLLRCVPFDNQESKK